MQIPIQSLIVPPSSTILRAAGSVLVDFWQKQTGGEVALTTAPQPHGKGVVCCSTESEGAWKELAAAHGADKLERDGFKLKTVEGPEGAFVLALGRTDRGAKQALYELMKRVHLEQGLLSIGPVDITLAPFFASRIITHADPSCMKERTLGPLDRQRFLYALWDRRKRLDYLFGTEAFGFNGCGA